MIFVLMMQKTENTEDDQECREWLGDKTRTEQLRLGYIPRSNSFGLVVLLGNYEKYAGTLIRDGSVEDFIDAPLDNTNDYRLRVRRCDTKEVSLSVR